MSVSVSVVHVYDRVRLCCATLHLCCVGPWEHVLLMGVGAWTMDYVGKWTIKAQEVDGCVCVCGVYVWCVRVWCACVVCVCVFVCVRARECVFIEMRT
jgi:hypothetical protein